MFENIHTIFSEYPSILTTMVIIIVIGGMLALLTLTVQCKKVAIDWRDLKIRIIK